MNDFNVNNLSKDNTDYAFKNLIYYIDASIELKEYKDYKKQFEIVLSKVKKILSIYINENDICKIDDNLLEDIKYDLIDLKVLTESLDSYFTEWSLQWLEAIISLKKVSRKENI